MKATYHFGDVYIFDSVFLIRHKYGIKVFKLCVSGGYTWPFKVYTGKERVYDVSVSEKVVKELMNRLLDTDRTLYIQTTGIQAFCFLIL